jgi:predicted RNA binding protein YcfA (HicA-like mRNA interferase family)
MTKRQKRLARLRQNPKDVTLDQLRRVIEDYGFEYRRTVGSHYTFTCVIGGETVTYVVLFHRPVKVVYVKRAIELIDEIIQERGEDEPEPDDGDEDA